MVELQGQNKNERGAAQPCGKIGRACEDKGWTSNQELDRNIRVAQASQTLGQIPGVVTDADDVVPDLRAGASRMSEIVRGGVA